MNPIYIHKGDCTIFADVKRFLTFNIETDLDLTGWKAKFILGWITKEIEDISSKSFEIVLSSEETKQLKIGTQHGSIILTDAKGHIKTLANDIPFEVTTAVVENEYQEIDLTIPQSSGVDILLKVGAKSVTSVNGMTGDVYLDIPSIEGLVTEQQLQQGLEGKQDKGDYALASDIPDLTDYVKNTDYASTSGEAGLIKTSSSYGTQMVTTGFIRAGVDTLESYKTRGVNFFIGKGTLENVKNDLVKRAVTENDIELSADEKASAKGWLGYADNTDIMQAIASIPQFNLSIVEALPETGAKMTLYLVPKEGTNNDVYDEYIWIEQTSSFEHLGTTAVDLTDYVKNTDYATESVGGVVKIAGNYFGLAFNSSKQLYVNKATDSEVTAKSSHYKPIVPANLDLAVKTSVTTNTIELTDDEKTTACSWLGAVSNTDYATSSKGGVFKTSQTYGTQVGASGALYGYIETIENLARRNNHAFIAKGTLENVLTQYSKTVLTTEADYDALVKAGTVDTNTLYLIEE